MKTLIVTVGTRQIGWRCQDGIVRCFGADGGRNDPPHTDELYRELGIERGVHPEGDGSYPWGTRDLGQRYYDHCTEWLGGDFSQVELLIDGQIIAGWARQGLDHIILWGTNQPETVSWHFRRLDTLWLAKLMEGKIKRDFPNIAVDVFDPIVAVNDGKSIRQELEEYILGYALERLDRNPPDRFTLLIENKGAAPVISESLAIYAAGLVRQYEVLIVLPEEPSPFYKTDSSACPSTIYQSTSLGEYFWPLERLRVISAWERGDFEEATIWLEPHQHSHEALYKLARWLTLAMNGEIDEFLIKIKNWMRSNPVRELAGIETIQAWQKKVEQINSNPYAKTWEFCFLFESLLCRKNYTNAFIVFSQILERLLALRCQGLNLDQPSFETLINEWSKLERIKSSSNWHKILHAIRRKRNDVIHQGQAITEKVLSFLWTDNGFSIVISDGNFIEVLKKVCSSSWSIPERTLLGSLSDWGLRSL